VKFYIIIGLIVATLAILITIVLIPSTRDFALDNPLWNGMSISSNRYYFKSIPSEQVYKLRSSDVLLIVGVERNIDVTYIRSFVYKGGKLIVFEDYGYGFELLKRMGIDVDVYRGILIDPLYYYKSTVIPRIRTIYNKTLFFNYGTAFSRYTGRCIAWSSYFSYIDLDLDKKPDSNEPKGPFCVGIEVSYGKGTIIVFSDASIAINTMFNLNKEFLDTFFKKGIYVVSDIWIPDLYTYIRSRIMYFLNICLYTSFRYPFLALLTLGIAEAFSRIYSYQKRKTIETKDIIKRVLLKHPSWNRDVIEQLLRDIGYGYREIERKD